MIITSKVNVTCVGGEIIVRATISKNRILKTILSASRSLADYAFFHLELNILPLLNFSHFIKKIYLFILFTLFTIFSQYFSRISHIFLTQHFRMNLFFFGITQNFKKRDSLAGNFVLADKFNFSVQLEYNLINLIN